MTEKQPDENKTPQSIRVLSQFLKDLSFENPAGGRVPQVENKAPDININVFVGSKQDPQNPNIHMIDLTLKAVSKIQDTPLFILDATYAGVFEIIGFEPTAEEQVINIQCPALLFPFLRRIVGEKTSDGGFPPLYLDPIDFFAIFMHKKRTQSQEIEKQKETENQANKEKQNSIIH